MGGFFHLKKERKLLGVSLGNIFLDKNSNEKRQGFFSKKLFPIQHLEFLSKNMLPWLTPRNLF